jgi:hypothetical protein
VITLQEKTNGIVTVTQKDIKCFHDLADALMRLLFAVSA